MAKTESGRFTLHTIAVTCDGSGAATVYSDGPVWGEVQKITYVKTNFADGVDFAITAETTTLSLWTDLNINATETVFPVVASNLGTDGSATTTYVWPILAGERVKIVIAQGGAATTGTFYVVVRR